MIGRETDGAWSQHSHVACRQFVETNFLISVEAAQQPEALAIPQGPFCLMQVKRVQQVQGG